MVRMGGQRRVAREAAEHGGDSGCVLGRDGVYVGRASAEEQEADARGRRRVSDGSRPGLAS